MLNFVFCGTLAPLNKDLIWQTNEYSRIELNKMELALLTTILVQTYPNADIFCEWFNDADNFTSKLLHPNYENALFNGMVASLEVLKSIHEAHGEVIDTAPNLPQRKLNVCP